jgi:thiol-disulfide isomerase/thioredoxin
VNYKLLIKKIITIFIFLKIITFSNLLFSQGFSDFEEQLLPEIILFDENKIKNNLSSYLNNSNHRLTIINFWATWCPPCIEELPSLNRLAIMFEEKGIDILAISMDKGDENKLTDFLKQKGGDKLKFFQDKNWSAGKSLPIKGLPITLIVNNNKKQTKIIYRHEGPLEWDNKEIRNNILSLVGNN